MASPSLTPTANKIVAYPWHPNQDLFPENTLEKIYHHLHMDGIYRELIHERELSKEEFLAFVTGYPETVLMIFVDMETGKYPGIGWITDIARTDTILRGVGAFAFFREFWDSKLPKECGVRACENWFNDMGFDLIYGLTPKPNRMARRFCSSLGFRYIADLPNFTCYHGKTVDGLICMLTKEEFNASDLHKELING